MKKVIGLMLIFMVIMSIALTSFATNSVLGDESNDGATTITPDEYEDAQQNSSNNKVNNKNNNTLNNDTSLPQTGIEDYNIAILLVICIGSAVFAYKKISDYRNI